MRQYGEALVSECEHVLLRVDEDLLGTINGQSPGHVQAIKLRLDYGDRRADAGHQAHFVWCGADVVVTAIATENDDFGGDEVLEIDRRGCETCPDHVAATAAEDSVTRGIEMIVESGAAGSVIPDASERRASQTHVAANVLKRAATAEYDRLRSEVETRISRVGNGYRTQQEWSGGRMHFDRANRRAIEGVERRSDALGRVDNRQRRGPLLGEPDVQARADTAEVGCVLD